MIITIALLLSTQAVFTNWKSLTGGSDGITLPLPVVAATSRRCRSTTCSS